LGTTIINPPHNRFEKKLDQYYLVPAYPSSTVFAGEKFHRCHAGGGRINQYTIGRAQKVIYLTFGTLFGALEIGNVDRKLNGPAQTIPQSPARVGRLRPTGALSNARANEIVG
jgi:hypothetical protein